MSIHRRELLGIAGGLVLGGVGTWAAHRYILPPMPAPVEREPAPMLCPLGPGHNLSPEEALQRLLVGNERFVNNRSQYRTEASFPGHMLTRDYRPFAAILCCSDARVVSEMLFDERLGELFVVRQAAHYLDVGARTSIEYAVNFLQVPLILVLGHQGCTALATVLGAERPDANPPAYLQNLRNQLNSVVKEVSKLPGDPLENAVQANVRMTVRQLQGLATLQPLIRENKLRVLGAHWALPTGKVTLLDVE